MQTVQFDKGTACANTALSRMQNISTWILSLHFQSIFSPPQGNGCSRFYHYKSRLHSFQLQTDGLIKEAFLRAWHSSLLNIEFSWFIRTTQESRVHLFHCFDCQTDLNLFILSCSYAFICFGFGVAVKAATTSTPLDLLWWTRTSLSPE